MALDDESWLHRCEGKFELNHNSRRDFEPVEIEIEIDPIKIGTGIFWKKLAWMKRDSGVTGAEHAPWHTTFWTRSK